MVTNPDQFDYALAPLPDARQTIRLLDIHPSSQTTAAVASANPEEHYSAALVCTMRTTSIASPEPFVALSYCWGSDKRTHAVVLHGKTFPITESVNEALRHIRDALNIVTVWIDQICINQCDNGEKSVQVGEMRSIYSKCQQVIVWLGPAADDSDFLMAWWRRIGQAARDLGIEQFLTREKIAQLRAIENNINPDDDLTRRHQAIVRDAHVDIERAAKAMMAWTSRPWFSRVWIIQEMALCSDTVFVCGHEKVDVTLVQLAGQIFDRSIRLPYVDSTGSPPKAYGQLMAEAQDRHPVQLFSARRRRQNLLAGQGTGDDLFNLLRKVFIGRKTMATQARDRVYGLLGLAVDADTLCIEPDYVSRSDVPAFVSSARAMIRNGRVEVLSFSQFPKDPVLRALPSWAPDWRLNLARSWYTINEYAEDHLLSASGTTSVKTTSHQDPNVLGLKGFQVDCIEEVGETWLSDDPYQTRLECLKKIQDMCATSDRKGESIYPSPERRAEAFWRVPVGDIYWTNDRDYERANLATEADYYANHRVLMVLLNMDPETAGRSEEQMAVFTKFREASGRYRLNMDAMTGMKPYLSRKGYVGMCCSSAQAGDVVVVFHGARIPYVLRPVHGGRFRYIGEAYCDGVMDGELVVAGEEADFFIE